MASQTQGIQQLLAAEKRAAEKINEARKRKAQRLKQAKQEAQAEIEKYRTVRAVSFYFGWVFAVFLYFMCQNIFRQSLYLFN